LWLNTLPLDKLGANRIAYVSVLAFLVGIMPDIAWQVVTKSIQSVLALKLPSFNEEYP